MKSKGCEKLCLVSVRVVVGECEEIFEGAVAIIESPRHSFPERKSPEPTAKKVEP